MGSRIKNGSAMSSSLNTSMFRGDWSLEDQMKDGVHPRRSHKSVVWCIRYTCKNSTFTKFMFQFLLSFVVREIFILMFSIKVVVCSTVKLNWEEFLIFWEGHIINTWQCNTHSLTLWLCQQKLKYKLCESRIHSRVVMFDHIGLYKCT